MWQGHGRDSKCTYWINIQNGHEQLKHEDFHPFKKKYRNKHEGTSV